MILPKLPIHAINFFLVIITAILAAAKKKKKNDSYNTAVCMFNGSGSSSNECHIIAIKYGEWQGMRMDRSCPGCSVRLLSDQSQ